MNTCGKMMQMMLRQWRTMELEDVVAWKLCVMLCGMLMAIYNAAFCKKARGFIWFGFLVTLAHTLRWFAKSVKKAMG